MLCSLLEFENGPGNGALLSEMATHKDRIALGIDQHLYDFRNGV
jgi:hypothetical protein